MSKQLNLRSNLYGAIKRALLFYVILLLLVSCAKPDSESNLSRSEKAKLFIQNKEYADAEKILLDESEQKNGDIEKVMLASIYVNRAEISIDDYFKFEKIFRDDVEKTESIVGLPKQILSLQSSKNGFLKLIFDFFNGIDKFLTGLHDFNKKVDLIPKIDQQGYEQLMKASLVLKELERPTKGQFLFRGIVKIIIFRYDLENQNFFQIGDSKLCSQKLMDFQNSLVRFRTQTISMLNDLQQGLPKESDKIANLSKQIENDIVGIEQVVGRIWTVDLNLADSLNELATRSGLEIGEIQCQF